MYGTSIGIIDYLLLLLYLVFIYLTAYVYSKIKSANDPIYKHLLKGLSAKIFGAIGFVMLSMYYWKGGDVFTYYHAADQFTEFSFQNPSEFFKLLFSHSEGINWGKYEFATGHHAFLRDNTSFTAVKLTMIANVFAMKSFLVANILFASLSFLGVWNMYYVFCLIYPKLQKQIFFALFLIPSVILWGSGILKDTITIAGVGWIVYGVINLIVLKRKRVISLIILIAASFAIYLLKPYILYVLYPSLFIWVQGNLKELIKYNLIRKLVSPFIALVMGVSLYFLSGQISEGAGKYNLDNVAETLEGFQSWHTTLAHNDDQSGYTLGQVENTPLGMLKVAPAAITVTFFRPFLWEVRNASTLLGALEGLVLIVITSWLILKYRLTLFKLIYKNRDILFLLIFALMFAVVVGISSYNFGALSRYKMPAQMFYVLALMLINKRITKENELK